MISPVFIVQMSTFMFTNISQNMMINVANDIMLNSKNIQQNGTTFETIQQQFEISRGVLGVITPPLCGIINELSSVCFQSKKKQELYYILLVTISQALVHCLVTGSILIENVWFFLIMQPILYGIMNNVFITGINVCYPVSVRATYLSLGAIGSTIFLFIQEPIMKQMKVKS